MFNQSGRVRVISDAVNDLTAEIRNAKALYSAKGATIDAGTRQSIERLAASVDSLTRQLEAVSANLNRVSQSPIFGLGNLMGRGEQDVQQLTRGIDALVSTVREVMRGVWR